jgi:Flp pilus assembly protein CpaB
VKGRMLIFVAILAGVAAVFLVNSRFSALESKANPPTRTFYRAAAGIAPGSSVADAMGDAQRLLAVEKISEDFARAHPDAVDESEIEFVKKRTIVRPVPAGEFLRLSHLEPVSGAEMRGRIPEGHQAIGIGVNQETSAGFLIAPGDVVDVYVAISRSDPTQPGGMVVEAKKVASGVTVFSTGTSLRLASGAPARPRGEPYSSVVVTAPPADVEAIIRARIIGKLTLVLTSKPAP